MNCLIYRQEISAKIAIPDDEFLKKQITSYNVLKNVIIRCAVEKAGKKTINVRILIDIINSILTLSRIQQIEQSNNVSSNAEFSINYNHTALIEPPVQTGDENMEGVHMIMLGAVTEVVYGSQEKTKAGLESLTQFDELFRLAK